MAFKDICDKNPRVIFLSSEATSNIWEILKYNGQYLYPAETTVLLVVFALDPK